jgi:hypothetical protein
MSIKPLAWNRHHQDKNRGRCHLRHHLRRGAHSTALAAPRAAAR